MLRRNRSEGAADSTRSISAKSRKEHSASQTSPGDRPSSARSPRTLASPSATGNQGRSSGPFAAKKSQTRALAAGVPAGPHLYPDDDLTDLPDRLLAAEIVREQIFLQIQEEIPYGTTVETENWQEKPDGSVRVEATVYVGRAGHKAILIGAGGSRIKEIGARARKELTGLLDRPVHLFLNVKERAGWDEEGARLRAIGLDDTA